MEKMVQELFDVFRNFRKLHFSILMEDISHSEFATLRCIARKAAGAECNFAGHMEQGDAHPENNADKQEAGGTADVKVSVSDLAEKLHVSPPALSRTLRRLEKKEFIRRTVDFKDRRNTDVELTEQGRAVIQKAEKTMFEFTNQVLRQMEPERLENLITGLQKLYDISQKELDNRKAKKKGE